MPRHKGARRYWKGTADKKTDKQEKINYSERHNGQNRPKRHQKQERHNELGQDGNEQHKGRRNMTAVNTRQKTGDM